MQCCVDTKKCLTPVSVEPLVFRQQQSLSGFQVVGVGFVFSVEDGPVLVAVGLELFYCIQCGGVGNWAVASGG